MIRCKAIHKFKNKKGATWGYTLEDVNHKTITLKSEDIKKMINNNQLCVLNLKITSDGRLVQTNRHINNGMIKVPRSNVPSWLKLTSTSKNKQVAYMNNSDAYDTNSEMYKHYYDLPKTTYRGGIKDKQGYIFEVMAISSSSEVGRLTGGIYHYNVNINYNGNPIRLIGYKAAFGRCYGTNIVKDLQDGYYLEDYLQKSLDEGAECDNLQLVQNIIKDNQYNSESYYDKKEREADGKLYGDKKDNNSAKFVNRYLFIDTYEKLNEKYTYVEVSRVNLGLDVILDNGVITAINVKTEGGLEIGSHKLSDYMVSEIGDKIEQLNNGERLNLRPASGYRFALDTVTHTIVCVVDAKDEKYTVVSNLVTDSKVFKAYSYHELINASTINSRITGIEVYIVGKSKYFKNRQSFKEFLSKRKIKVTDSITEYTEYLITNENKDDDSIDDFKKETVKIIDEEYAIKLALFAF